MPPTPETLTRSECTLPWPAELAKRDRARPRRNSQDTRGERGESGFESQTEARAGGDHASPTCCRRGNAPLKVVSLQGAEVETRLR